MRRKIRAAMVAIACLLTAAPLFVNAEERPLTASEVLALSSGTVAGVSVAKESGGNTSFGFGPGLFVDWDGTKGAHLLVGGELFSDGSTGTRYTVFVGGRRIQASLVNYLARAEVSVIRLAEPWSEAKPVNAARGAVVSEGDELYVVYCLPFVFRHRTAVRRTVCTGRREWTGGVKAYRTSLLPAEGMTGALVYDGFGRPVGIAEKSTTGALPEVVVVPLSEVGKYLKEMREKKTAARTELKPSDKPAWFGAVISANSSRVYSCYSGRKPKLDGKAVTWGAFVSGVLPGSPAAENGFRTMDLIIEVNGVRVANEYADLEAFFASLEAGKEVKVKFLRYNPQAKEWDLKERRFTLSPRPPVSSESETYKDDFFKIEVCPFTWDLRIKTVILDAYDGVYLKKVEEGGAFGLFGIESGTVVLRVNGTDTPDLASFKKAVAPFRNKSGAKLELLVCTPDGYNVPVFRRIKIP